MFKLNEDKLKKGKLLLSKIYFGRNKKEKENIRYITYTFDSSSFILLRELFKLNENDGINGALNDQIYNHICTCNSINESLKIILFRFGSQIGERKK